MGAVQGLLGRLLHWDLGESFANRRGVNEILYERAPRSIRLAFWAVLIEIVVGISVGLISAVKRYSLTDKATTVATTAAAAIPVFVLGFILQYVFAVIPNNALARVDGPAHIRSRPGHVVRLLHPHRGAMALPDPPGRHARLRVDRPGRPDDAWFDARRAAGRLHPPARSKGLGERSVVLRHGLRNALIPVVTLIGIDFGTVIGAAVLTETVYSWPGIGSRIVEAVQEARSAGDPRPHAGRHHRLHRRQHDRRHLLRLVRSADPPRGPQSHDGSVVKDFFRRFAKNRMAVAGLCFIVLLVLAAIFAPWITSYGWKERTPELRQSPSVSTGSAPTRSATTSSPVSCTEPVSR